MRRKFKAIAGVRKGKAARLLRGFGAGKRARGAESRDPRNTIST